MEMNVQYKTIQKYRLIIGEYTIICRKNIRRICLNLAFSEKKEYAENFDYGLTRTFTAPSSLFSATSKALWISSSLKM